MHSSLSSSRSEALVVGVLTSGPIFNPKRYLRSLRHRRSRSVLGGPAGRHHRAVSNSLRGAPKSSLALAARSGRSAAVSRIPAGVRPNPQQRIRLAILILPPSSNDNQEMSRIRGSDRGPHRMVIYAIAGRAAAPSNSCRAASRRSAGNPGTTCTTRTQPAPARRPPGLDRHHRPAHPDPGDARPGPRRALAHPATPDVPPNR